MHSNRLLELASVISTSVISINDYLGLKGLPTPSFDPDAPRTLPDEIDAARNAVLDATSELHDLLLEPADLLRTFGSHANLISLHAIQRFKIASSFAVGDQVSFAHIATSCNQSELNIRRLLRHAMTLRVFREPRKGFVAHTAASRLLADPCMLDWLGNTCEETWPAAVRTVDAMCKWPGSEEPNHCGFSLANDTQDSMYQSMARNPVRARRFAGAMAAYTTGKGYDNSHLLDNYDWTSLGNGLIVDVGGSHGHISVSIAQRYDHLNFVVQDLKEIISEAASELPGNLTARVKFMAHDFLTDQPVRAHLYYFRWIFHNWSDKYCIRILRCLVPALRPGARILIHDSCMPELNTAPKWREKMLRSMDIGMLAILNAREREFEDWQQLFQQADHRFRFLGVTKPKGANLAIIEARWEGEGVERQEKGLLN